MKNVNCPIAYRAKIMRNEISSKIFHCVGDYVHDIMSNSIRVNLKREVKDQIYLDVLNNGWNSIVEVNEFKDIDLLNIYPLD